MKACLGGTATKTFALASLAAAAVTAVSAQVPAYADLKCGDAPFKLGNEGLVVTWSGPASKDGRFAVVHGDIFGMKEETAPERIFKDYPEKYIKGLQQVDIFNPHISLSVDDFVEIQRRYEIDMKERPLEIFRDYTNEDYAIVTTAIEHPEVPDPREYVLCSVVFQRGAILYRNGRETLTIQSHLHSAKDEENFVNLVPRGGVQMAFSSDVIWFPLALSEVIDEPASYVVLDILTSEQTAIEQGQLPEPFQLVSTAQVSGENISEYMPAGSAQDYAGETFNVARVVAKLEAGRSWPDLEVRP